MQILIKTFLNQNLIHKKRFGGGKYDKIKTLSFNYNSQIYKIKIKIEYDDNDEFIENIYILHDNDNNDRCMILIIYRDEQYAIIQDFKSNINCIKSDIYDINNGFGNILMKFTIELLKINKDKLNIKRIILTDNSVIPCNSNRIHPNINFSDLYTLINGCSWYAKFGFKIYSNNKHKLNEITNIFNNNKNIIENTKFNIDMFKSIILDSLKDSSKIDYEFLKDNINFLINTLSKYNNINYLKDVLKDISVNNCNLFRILINSVMNKYGLESLSIYDYVLYL